jgi:UDP-N-acetylmuramate dehydrogenase
VTFHSPTLDFGAPLSSAEPLAKHCTIKVGGPARWWIEPNTEEELAAALQSLGRDGAPLYVFGAGSNLVPHDSGWDGAVLKLGSGFVYHHIDGTRLIAGGGAMLPRLSHIALKAKLGNFEWACGIPGSIGGSLWGNAGSRGWNGNEFESRDCSADLHSCVAFDRKGQRHELQKSDIEFSYRKSSLGELIVTEATFDLKPLDEIQAESHREAVRELLRIRRETQPVNAASAGCAWKNPKAPDCASAGQLVEKLGLKGHSIGGAAISELHGNFVINRGDATGTNVRELIADVERRVREATGIELEREVRLLDG